MKLLRRVLMASDKELGMLLLKKLGGDYNCIITDKNNYIYAVGNSPLCLVAHMDTCCKPIDQPVTLNEHRNIITNTRGILGADDRAGVYAIIEVVSYCKENNITLPSIIFTNYEESGGSGVKEFIKSKQFRPDNINLFIELDRKGCNEYVYYSLSLPGKVKSYIESFGFREDRGSYSDIADLTREYEIPSVNLSVGYYNQHSTREKLHYDELLMTIDRVCDMCEDPLVKLYPVVKPNYGNYHRGYEDYDFDGGFGGYGNRGTEYGMRTGKKKEGSTDKHLGTTPALPGTESNNKVTSIHSNSDGVNNPREPITQTMRTLLMRALSSNRFDIQSDLNENENLNNTKERYLGLPLQDNIWTCLDVLEEDYILKRANNVIKSQSFIEAWNNLMVMIATKM